MERSITVLSAFVILCTLQAVGQVRRNKPVTGGKIGETTHIINDCERRTNSFKKTLDHALARDNVRAGQGRENQLNSIKQ